MRCRKCATPTQPLFSLQEAALIPANPRWMATVALPPNMKTFAA
jgi:hypothetical protein